MSDNETKECFEGISHDELVEELARCHERLEIAYCYRSTDSDDETLFNWPKTYLSFDERKTFPDLIECLNIEVRCLEKDVERIRNGAIRMAAKIAQTDDPEEIRKVYNEFVKASDEVF